MFSRVVSGWSPDYFRRDNIAGPHGILLGFEFGPQRMRNFAIVCPQSVTTDIWVFLQEADKIVVFGVGSQLCINI